MNHSDSDDVDYSGYIIHYHIIIISYCIQLPTSAEDILTQLELLRSQVDSDVCLDINILNTLTVLTVIKCSCSIFATASFSSGASGIPGVPESVQRPGEKPIEVVTQGGELS